MSPIKLTAREKEARYLQEIRLFTRLQIAEAMGISRGRVYELLKAAKSKLSARVENWRQS